MIMDINCTASITTIAKALKNKEFSSYELTHHYLEKCKKNQELNAFISLTESNALAMAKKADAVLAKGVPSLLCGIPMAHKDIFCTKESTTTCGSRMLERYQSPFDATIVSNLASQYAVSVGKTNMDEFAMGSATKNSYFGPCHNPWNNSCVPGGSSGGSAAAVAADLCVWSTGSDTGGSIRQPASFCGVTGIKPTYGLASRYGMIAYASSLDQAGPIAKSAEDCAIILQHMTGFDPRDSTSNPNKKGDFSAKLTQSIKNLKIGLPECFFDSNLDSGIASVLQKACVQLEQAGAIITPVKLQHYELWVPCYYVIACAEASSNLSRYDGIRFGHQSKVNASDLHSFITNSREEGFGEEVKRRIITGTHLLSAGYYDAYYLQALRLRRIIQNDFFNAFKDVDVLLGPTCPSTAFAINSSHSDPTEDYLADVFTVGANLAGLPAMSLPAGFIEGLPVGMQLIGQAFEESTLLQVGHQYQQISDWHLQQPPL